MTTGNETERAPRWSDDVPWCDEACPQHDGKRCMETGNRPDSICEPEVRDIVVRLRVKESEVQA